MPRGRPQGRSADRAGAQQEDRLLGRSGMQKRCELTPELAKIPDDHIGLSSPGIEAHLLGPANPGGTEAGTSRSDDVPRIARHEPCVIRRTSGACREVAIHGGVWFEDPQFGDAHHIVEEAQHAGVPEDFPYDRS